MIISKSERVRLRASVEDSIAKLGEGPEKNLLLIVLALLLDLDEADPRCSEACEPAPRLPIRASIAVSTLKSIKTTAKQVQLALLGMDMQADTPVDESCMQNFAHMAEQLQAMTDNVWILKNALEQLHAAHPAKIGVGPDIVQ